ncbi:hypothetical protein CL635_02275 [bacterium]|nr:hypothetical protein [bacterium]|tara:strand:+ start:568 stop:849 length:282 start_codon:yes stop_codon:yes gene_type:complete
MTEAVAQYDVIVAPKDGQSVEAIIKHLRMTTGCIFENKGKYGEGGEENRILLSFQLARFGLHKRYMEALQSADFQSFTVSDNKQLVGSVAEDA